MKEDFLRLFAGTSEDKDIFIPGIGQTSCKQIHEMYEKCAQGQTIAIKSNFCSDFEKLSKKCFSSSQKKFEKHVKKLVHESDDLMNFLEKNGSQIPGRLKMTKTYDYFTIFSNKNLSDESNNYLSGENVKQAYFNRIDKAKKIFNETKLSNE